MQRTVLVTGATGFIGRHFCTEALNQGFSVYALVRQLGKASKILPPQVKSVLNVEDIPTDVVFYGVVNLAGEPLAKGRWNRALKQKFYQSRIGTTETLYAFFEKRHQTPDVLVSGSAIGFYGPHGDELLDETSGFKDCFSHRLCAAWEQAALAFEKLGTRVCLLRTGIVLGKNEGALKTMQLPFKLGLGGKIGTGQQWMSWIHIDDLIAIIFHLLTQTTAEGPINGTAPNPVTNQEFTRVLATTLRRPAIFPMPGFMAKLLFGEMAEELLLTGQKVLPKKAEFTGFTFRHPNLNEALGSLYR